MKILFFSRTIGGHYLEYIHHLYLAALEQSDNDFVFVLPRRFEDLKDHWDWPVSSHISIKLFGVKTEKYKSDSFIQQIRNSWNNSLLLRNYVRQFKADAVYCNSLMGLMPLVPVLIDHRVKLSGVIYKIYLYDSNQSRVSLVFNRLMYQIMSRVKLFHRLFILNDFEGVDYLNSIYHTQKFVSIPDPFVPIMSPSDINVRKDLGIPFENKLFVQFGTLCSNKSTLEILESLRSLSEKERKNYTFVFAGVVYDEIKPRFYELIEELSDTIQIIVKDEFCSYDFIASLCQACDAILTPYKRTAQSSGLIGYASQFGKPVIATSQGLLGRLVGKYKLGLLIDKVDSENLVNAYRQIASGTISLPGKDYCQINSVSRFQKSIMSNII